MWEEFEKVQPDGTTKRFRRRYISTYKVVLKKPTASTSSDEVQYEEIPVDESKPNDDAFNPDVSDVFIFTILSLYYYNILNFSKHSPTWPFCAT